MPATDRDAHERSWRTIAFCASAAAAGIHFGAARAHLGEYAPAGVFMVASGLGQLVWAVWAALGAPRRVLLAGVAGNAAIAALWVISRTVGLPWAHEPWTPEHVLGADALATGLEVIVVAAAVALSGAAVPRANGILLRLAVAGALASVIVAGDDPPHERAVAAATLVLAIAARAHAAATARLVRTRPIGRRDAQVPTVPRSAARLGPVLRAGAGAR